jgi:dTDP-4-amino-4,6-dideoxygalactose transaminase
MYDLAIVEDAACSLGANYYQDNNSRKVGTIGDIGCFSLQASKGITTGCGGLICTNDDVLADRMRKQSCFGDERVFRRGKNPVPFHFDPKAGNYKMSDITAAIALSQLKKIEKLIEWRIKIAIEWDWIISNDDFLKEVIISKPKIVINHSHIYQSYVAVCAKGRRPAVMDYFKECGFQTGIGTHACHRYDSLNELDGGQHDLQISDYLFHNAISLPRYFGLEVKKEWEKAKYK